MPGGLPLGGEVDGGPGAEVMDDDQVQSDNFFPLCVSAVILLTPYALFAYLYYLMRVEHHTIEHVNALFNGCRELASTASRGGMPIDGYAITWTANT